MAGIYLAEFGDVVFVGHSFLTHVNSFLSSSLRFLNNVLTQFPSIVVGILAYTTIVVALGSFSTIAGAIALSIIMLPIVTRTTEESIKLVPGSIRDAAAALGIRKWRDSKRSAKHLEERSRHGCLACHGTDHRGDGALDSDGSGKQRVLPM